MGIKSEEGKQQTVQEEKSKLERSDRKSLTGKIDKNDERMEKQTD